MKRFITILAALACTLSALAQTPEDIISNMEDVFTEHDNGGLFMVVDVKIPILGTMSSKVWNFGDKTCVEGSMMDVKIISWSDKTTEWDYDSKNNTITIKNADPTKIKNNEGDAEMFDGITDGYDVTIKSETDKEWHLVCKKSRNNPDNDAPKTMDLVVAKDTYWPISLSTKMKGITMTMRDISFDVTEADVTFDQSKFPGATIEDKR